MNKSAKSKELAEFTAKLALFTRRGVPIDEIIKNIGKDLKDPSLKEAFDRVADSASGGSAFWVSLESAPPIYPDYIKEIIRAGEMDNRLAETLNEVAQYLTESHQTEEIARNAIKHPMIPVNFICLFAVFAFLFLTPMIADLYGGMTLQLPLPTKLFVFISNLFRNTQFLMLYFGLLALFNILLIIKDPLKNRLLMKVNISGNIIKKYYTYLLARLTSLMMNKGMTAEYAMNVLSSNPGFEEIKDSIVPLSQEMERGRPIGDIIGQCAGFPQSFRWMLQNMKNEGELEEYLRTAADYYRKDLKTLQVRTTQTLSGVYVLAFSGVLLIIILSLFLPMYQLIGTLS